MSDLPRLWVENANDVCVLCVLCVYFVELCAFVSDLVRCWVMKAKYVCVLGVFLWSSALLCLAWYGCGSKCYCCVF